MAYVRSRKHSSTVQPLIQQSLVALAAFMVPMHSHAQEATPTPPTKTLPTVDVKASAEVPYKADKVTNPKLTQPLVDTPQTISVIKKEIIQEQNATTLMEVLRNTPGITMQLGENGNTSAGDTFQMRGFSTQSSVFIDGIRDLGAVTRDSFNIEQVEVSKGPSGADIGRGASSGYINLVSKVPLNDNFNSAMLTVNTASNVRVAADLNRKVGETAAVRLNVMNQNGGVPGRDEVESNGYGIAPSFAIGLGTPTRFYIYSQHIRQDNVPDGGVSTIGLSGFYNANSTLRNVSPVDPKNYYGSNNDYEDVKADMITFRGEHDFGKGVTLRNTSRYGKTEMDRIITGVGTTLTAPSDDPSTWTVNRSRQSVLQENEILANLTNVTAEFKTGSIEHNLSFGLELSYEKQNSTTRGGLGTMPNANLYNPNASDPITGMSVASTGAYTKGNTTTAAVYVFDTLKLNKSWQVNGGIRFERYNTETNSVTLSTLAANPTLPVGTPIPASLSKSDNLLSWKAGALYKLTPNSSLYAAYATSLTPPGSANFSLSTEGSNNVNTPNLDPQKTKNIELGTKWDLRNNTLALTAALYRTENENEFAVVDTLTNQTGQTGKRRVQGIELTAAGQLTDNWQLSAGIATMNTKILSGTTGNNTAGAVTRWSPKLTGTLWTTYKLADWTFGGGARYVSDQDRVVDPNANVSTQNMPKIPSYWVADAMISYRVSKNVTLQLNVYNLFDKEYINTLNNSGTRYTPGSPRYAALTANFLF